jgi:Tfp pilus assembly pilus retraction ATPase PilT
MSLMPSLCAALERAGGERLVMRAGERPHVLAGTRRHDVASAVLSVNAVEALAEQILSVAARQDLAASGSVSEPVHSPSFPRPLTARAERVGDDFCVELIVSMQVEAATTTEVPVMHVEQPPAIAEPAPLAQPAPPEEPAIIAPPDQTPVSVMADPEPTPVSMMADPEPTPISVVAAPEQVPVSMSEPVATPVVVIPQVVAEAPRQEQPEPARQPEVTVVTRVQEPVRPSRPATHVALDLFAWISHAADLGATTLYLRGGSPAAARIDERIQPISQETVAPSVIEEATSVFTRGGDGLWEPRADGEWVREDDELGYVNCRVFTDLQGSGLIIQLRPSMSLRLLHKHIPRQVRAACEGNGLVVVSASTEADVEALAAAAADWSGRDRGGYLISLQRRSRSHGDITGAFVSQRTIGGNEKDFAAAIRRAAQEGPDILLVTGLQADQPLQAAVLAAAGGRLVIAGVVAPTTVEALQMLAGSDSHVRRAMAASFRAAIGYRSLRRLGGGRTLIQDVVLATGSVCGLIESGDFSGLARIQNDVASRMRSVDESLARAVTRRQISLREAASHAIDRSHLVAMVRSNARTNQSGRLALAGARTASPSGVGTRADEDPVTAAPAVISGVSRY